MASRSLADLADPLPARARELLARAGDRLELLIYCTRRSLEEQARLFRHGRALATIRRRADQLDRRWGRPDLAETLLGVGPQYERRIVTHAAPGQSLHNYGLAWDAVPLRGGKPVWGTRAADDRAVWRAYGELVRGVGLEWAGDWRRFREYPHAQQPGVDWRELIREGG